MNSIISLFIGESLKNEPKQWAELRKFDLKVLKEIGLGYADNEVYTTLIRNDKEAMVKSQLIVGGRYKYVNCVILKVSDDYFIAKPSSMKNLFLKGTKHSFYIKGTDKTCYVTEGETDAIRLKHIFPDSSMFSLGGSTSVGMIKELPQEKYEKIIFAFDNDEAGKEALPKAVSKIKQTCFQLQFDEKFKDIDEYFKGGGKEEDLKLIEVKATKREPTNNNIRLIQIKQGVNSGTRNNAAFQLASEYVKKKIEPDEINILMNEWNAKNNPPLDEVELINCINGAYYQQNKKLNEKDLNILTRRGQIENFWNTQPFYYDKSKIFYLWNKELFKWEISDEVDFCNSIYSILGMDTINRTNKGEIVESFKQVGRMHKPKDMEKSWVQFKDRIYDIKTGKDFEATPEYFVTNPIPYKVGDTEETPIIDGYFDDWMEGQDKSWKKTLYEIMAYNICRDKFMQRIMALCGGGSNGKGTYAKLNYKFLGDDNCVASEIKNLSEDKFEPAVLYQKLLCVMGEVHYDDLKNTNQLKKLGGEDKMSFNSISIGILSKSAMFNVCGGS